jgi:phosphopantetheinyl transferase
MGRSTEEIQEMTTASQRGDQDGLKSGSRRQFERSHYAQQRCRWQASKVSDLHLLGLGCLLRRPANPDLLSSDRGFNLR